MIDFLVSEAVMARIGAVMVAALVAICGEELPDNWSNGQITWRIPVAWGRINNGSEECARNEFGEPYYQIFRMSNNGTLRIIKFEDYWVERTPQGVRSRADKVEGGYL
jgi:hypothetical protein